MLQARPHHAPRLFAILSARVRAGYHGSEEDWPSFIRAPGRALPRESERVGRWRSELDFSMLRADPYVRLPVLHLAILLLHALSFFAALPEDDHDAKKHQQIRNADGHDPVGLRLHRRL